ncbi:MAG: rRNA maturation RNase YbeY [Pseudomonadota bacterium]
MTAPEIELAVEDPRWDAEAGVASVLRAAAAAALEAAGVDGAGRSISILLTADGPMAELNGRFRGKPAPTNVLSWPAEDLAAEAEGAAPAAPSPPAAPDQEPESLGDLALARETLAREAAEAGKPLDAHLFHLAAHGTLHLLGYDHEREGDAARMEALESRICLAAGHPDPYLAEIEAEAPRPPAAAASEKGP